MMNNDMSNPTNHDARTSCEEAFTEDMGPADWANEETPRERFEREVGSDDELDEQHEPMGGQCEDAPCCGCCGPEADDGSIDDGYGTYADDAWHDAQSYPEW